MTRLFHRSAHPMRDFLTRGLQPQHKHDREFFRLRKERHDARHTQD